MHVRAPRVRRIQARHRTAAQALWLGGLACDLQQTLAMADRTEFLPLSQWDRHKWPLANAHHWLGVCCSAIALSFCQSS